MASNDNTVGKFNIPEKKETFYNFSNNQEQTFKGIFVFAGPVALEGFD